MRLDSVQSFPWMMTLGAVQDDQLIYDFGVEVARQLKELGIQNAIFGKAFYEGNISFDDVKNYIKN